MGLHFCVIHVNPAIDPSASLRTPVRTGLNGTDRVLGDKERRVMETFSLIIFYCLLIIVFFCVY